MVVTLIGTVGLIVTALIGVLGGRNDRAQANLEADLLAKLDPDSEAARRLLEVVEQRIGGWHDKAFKSSSKLPDLFGQDVKRSLTPRRNVGTGPIWFAAVVFAVLVIGGIVLAIATSGQAPKGPDCVLLDLLCPAG
ncbi:hypothetical protein [Microlunatus sp. Gsoil 973]|uniref:hypothetical protein n=1 Tax=Microlunatus sp. Gsoil 973 TaxID=2672569 RepID=UPI0012B4F1A3|nr:hypothetical protein [Microlunatus sp. Gsoil 973]QGN31696.1 hypothetical protein GJV80_01390 [Microlunatus sp. Gsoil 973]